MHAPNHLYQTALHSAVSLWGYASSSRPAQQQAIIRTLLGYGAPLQAVDWYGETPLHKAAAAGALPLVEVLLEAAGRIDGLDKLGRTPLHRAAHAGHQAVVKVLLEQHKALLAVGDSQGQTPLHLAARQGHRAVVAQLARAGADVYRWGKQGEHALHQATAQGHTDVVKLLHENYGVSLATCSVAGYSPLHLAVRQGHQETIRYLLSQGAQGRGQEQQRRDVLAWADRYGHRVLVEKLIAQQRTTPLREAPTKTQDYGLGR